MYFIHQQTSCFDIESATFILQSIPKLDNYDFKTKSDVISMFHKVVFYPKEALMVEGEVSNSAYLIFNGECSLKCKNNSHLNNGYTYYESI